MKKENRIMNTKGIKFLAVLAVLAMAFAAIAVLDVQQTDAVEADDADVAKIGDTGYKTLEEAIAAATGESTEIVLLMDVNATLANFTQESISEKTIAIDLATYTLTLENTAGITIENGVKLIFTNGKIVAKDYAAGTTGVFLPRTGSSVEVDDVTVETTGTAFFPAGDAATVVIKNSTVTAGTYAVGTNAGTTDNYKVAIVIENSELYSTEYEKGSNDGDTCTVMLNVEGSLNIKDSDIYGKRQVVFVRAGNAVLENVNVVFEPNYVDPTEKKTGTWGTGNNVPEAAIVIGNDRDSAFLADANVTLKDVAVTIVQNEVESKQCFDVLWIEDYKNTEEEPAVDTFKTNVTIESLTVPATGIVTINAGTVNDTGITAKNLTAGATGMTISKGSVVLSGDIDGGEITGDVTIKDANIVGNVTITGNVLIEGDVVIASDGSLKVNDISDDEKTYIEFVEESSLTGDVKDDLFNKMVFPVVSGSGDNDLEELGCPVVEYDGKQYIAFTVKYGSTKQANFGVLVNLIPYTGSSLTPAQVDQTLAAFTEASSANFFGMAQIVDVGADVGTYHYMNSGSFSSAGSTTTLSLIVPFKIVPGSSASDFVADNTAQIGGKDVGTSKIEQEGTEVGFESKVVYVLDGEEYDSGYYVAFDLYRAGTKEALPEGALVEIVEQEGKDYSIFNIDGTYFIYLGADITADAITMQVVIDYDGAESTVDNYDTVTYDLTITAEAVNLVSFSSAADAEYFNGFLIGEKEAKTLIGSDFATVTHFDREFNETDNVYEVVISVTELNYVFGMTQFSSNVAEQYGYYVPFKMKIASGVWDNVTVNYVKKCTLNGVAGQTVGQMEYPAWTGETDIDMLVILHGTDTVIEYTVISGGQSTVYRVTFNIGVEVNDENNPADEPVIDNRVYQVDAKYQPNSTGNPYGRAYADDVGGNIIYMLFANVNGVKDLYAKAYYLGDGSEVPQVAYAENLSYDATNKNVSHTWYFNAEDLVVDNENKQGLYELRIYDSNVDGAEPIAVAEVVYGTINSVITIVEYIDEDKTAETYVVQLVAGNPVAETESSYTVDMAGTIVHYITKDQAKDLPVDKAGYYLIFQINHNNMKIESPATVDFGTFYYVELELGVYIVYLGADYSALAEPTFKVDLDGDGEKGKVFLPTEYKLLTAGVDFGTVTVVLQDSYLVDEGECDYDEVYKVVKEGEPYRLPNGKDSSRTFDRWTNDDGCYPEYAYDSIFMGAKVMADEYGYIYLTAVYGDQLDTAVDLAVIIGENSAKVNIYGANGLLVPAGKIIITYKTWADRNGVKYLKNETKEITVPGGTSIVNTLESFDLDNVKCFKVSYASNDDVPVKQNTAWQML